MGFRMAVNQTMADRNLRIKKLLANGLTRKEIAKSLGVSYEVVSSVINNPLSHHKQP